ncbi:ABC1 kinase family protein [Sulfitobacter guttiformis]|uniref:Putative unusual protein kinase regulating ubiquinone biosynthesis (AarF/ABC1/UbiB family) n=1 Tax=Sulfitobacter guttiformis TaxID=74349 RepID=A0A420DPA3_9RHOB|nr:AarF/ABC1/UbiB kinase family protein [Sulfitobacter guttiformis]KIN73452.1 ABC1 family protein [Sulfitobacter guttiformis KCTC 32187]RKE96114.1 putative unusual protein kinase regulating ubiquinone biosynthesis (AarF/ABC1/UbiB family) [Sulfitobacter guttiformis]
MSGARDKGLAVPSSRLGRLTRLGTMTAGVAGNMALGSMAQLGRGQRPEWRDLLLTPANVTRIADQLAKMRGAAMKIGQLVSMDTGDVLPPELSGIMARLRDDAHFMPPAQLKKVLGGQWHEGWLRDFARFDVRPIAAASIGQVHRAQTHDGRDMAIKVQYPGVARSIDSDVANVGALIRMSGMLPKGFAIDPYLAEAALQLHEETDYLREARCLMQFRDLLVGTDGFVLPEVCEDWSTKSILAMSFVTGKPIEAAETEDKTTRELIMRRLVDLTLKELFQFKLMQSDPNFANYQYNPATGDIVLLDFGATRPLSSSLSNDYRAFLKSGLDGEYNKLEEVAVSIGFITNSMPERHRAKCLQLMCTAFEALGAPLFDFTDKTLTREMQRGGEALARDGFIPPVVPMDVLYLQRKFGGMFLLGARLGTKLPVADMMRRYLEV